MPVGGVLSAKGGVLSKIEHLQFVLQLRPIGRGGSRAHVSPPFEYISYCVLVPFLTILATSHKAILSSGSWSTLYTSVL